MRVAFNLEQLLSPSPGGVGRYAARLVSHLAMLGVEVRPVVARHSPQEVRAAWDEFGLAGLLEPTRSALPRPFLYDSWHLAAWPPLSRDARVDVLHAPSLAVPPRNGKPLVVSVHDAAPWLFPEAFSRRGRWFHAMGARVAARRADRIITGTQAAAEELVRCTSLPEARIRVVPYGVDGPALLTGNTDEHDAFLHSRGLNDVAYVLWVGSLEPRKGVGTLVAAMARLAQGIGRSAPPACLVLAGYAGWQNTELVAPQDREALGPALRQFGRVSEAELRALYARAAVFAFPSLHEGFGLPVLEAMAAGVPVVASDIPAVREVAGGAATLVPAGDVAAWAEALGGMLGEGGLSGAGRARLVEAGRARAARFPWGATAAATLAVYEEVVG